MVACPWGKRCLIVSAKGSTTAYGRNGYRVNSFPSHLPGGNRQQPGRFRDNAILDCIYHEVEKTFYVLDLMNWKDNPVYDSDTDFRYFWMMSKMQELPEVGEVSKLNPYKFIPLQYHSCKRDTLETVFQTMTQQIDGVLFYHKKAHYTFGRSPLVVWLKPYMISEMLGIKVPDSMMQQKPANYSTYADHLTQVKETKEKIEKDREVRKANRNKKRGPDRSRQFKMDLMESQWLTGIPENFETDWCTVVCPVGQRCLVMAIDGETKCFSKKGFRLPGYFLSVLPGGNGHDYGFGPTVVTLLDCVYCEEMLTYFILDCIMWGSQDLKEIPYTDRMQYVRREIMKRAEIKMITDLNMFKFVPLYMYVCSLESIDLALRQSTFDVDGILFFKKDVKYQSGETDEVLWSKPYILPDVFDGIAVPKKLMSQKPDTYTTFESFVDDVRNGKIRNKKNKKKKSKEFVPTVQIILPPPVESSKEGKKKNKKKKQVQQQVAPQGQYGQIGSQGGPGYRRGMILDQLGRGFNPGGQSRGGNSDSYSRLLSGGEAGRQIYGQGSVTGYPYYGDDNDYYYGNPGYGSKNRRDMGSRQDAFRMDEMHNALSYYDNSGRKPGHGRHYRLF